MAVVVEKKQSASEFEKDAVKNMLKCFSSDEKIKFETEVYKLGLKLIEEYKAGTCLDRNKTLEMIIEIFKRG